jgi:integrase
MINRARQSLSMLLTNAMERGLATRNVARGLTSQKGRGRSKLKAGVNIPTPDEIRTILPHLKGRWRPLFMVAAFCGLRSSEIRGLIWPNVDLDERTIKVTQRADKFNVIGDPKSEDGHRTIPMMPMVANALREWKVQCPPNDAGLVFPNGKGNIDAHNNIVIRGLQPIMVAAGVVDPDGRAKYPGLHALRHYYASWLINRKPGGLELPPKDVQYRLGHSTIGMTMDVYGHLFPRDDAKAEQEAAEKAFLGG